MSVDYSIYLVTDSTMVPEGTTFLSQIQKAVDNGVTIVQLREKHLSTRAFIERAQQVLAITRPKNVPLIINDRVDVALAVDADGVHVGQDDMPAAEVRRLLGPGKIVGVSCSSESEIAEVCREKVADYVGLGTLYPTNTKDVKTVNGPSGVRKMLRVIQSHRAAGNELQCVAIGGIKHHNVAKVRAQCRVPGKTESEKSSGNKIDSQGIDGVAVVSCIMAAEDAAAATKDLVASYTQSPAWTFTPQNKSWDIASCRPLMHHVTNAVVKQWCANISLAVGGSPIMSEVWQEFEEFASLPIPLGLVLNCVTPDAMQPYTEGLRVYNKHGKPVLLDPVAAGATSGRLQACRLLLDSGHVSVIKGNMGEVMALAKIGRSQDEASSDDALMQGVDSVAQLSDADVERLGVRVAEDFQTIVVISGKKNYVFGQNNENRAALLKIVPGGHPYMGSVTGTGCALGSVILGHIACAQFHKTRLEDAVVQAVELYNACGKRAGEKTAGPGTFAAAFLDELAAATNSTEK